MFIKYFIPEDGDEQAHPNVFKLESSQPSFSEVKKVRPIYSNRVSVKHKLTQCHVL